jgi:transposase
MLETDRATVPNRQLSQSVHSALKSLTAYSIELSGKIRRIRVGEHAFYLIAEHAADRELGQLLAGEFPTTDAATRKLIGKLAAKLKRLTFCYEAGPTRYGLYRLITSLGHECQVTAPSLTPKKPGDHVKTNRRNAVSLARLSRAGEFNCRLGARRAA